MQLVVLASGSGSNFEAIVRGCKEGKIDGQVSLLICDKDDAYALKRAEQLGIKSEIVRLKDFSSKEDYEKKIVSLIKKENPDFICLAGYMKIVSHTFLEAYLGKIINIHPSLLPKYKGKDAIGDALAAGETEIGATVHFVNEFIDDGEIIDQIKFSIDGLLEKEVYEKLHKHEHELYIRALNSLKDR